MKRNQSKAAASQVLRPTRGSRIGAWALLVFGVAFALSGLAGDLAGGLTMACAGAVFVGVGFSLVTARATVGAAGLSYRYGFRHFSIPATQVKSVGVGRGSGAFYGRVAVLVATSSGRRIRLTALQAPATAGSKSGVEAQAKLIRSALNLRSAAE